jgi:endonuclease YncB( thermonuclease family)
MRIASAEWITPNILRRKQWITGVVTSVGDGDNFRLYHTPGFGWRGLLKFRHIPKRSRELVRNTIHIRMVGVDAPERAHFGKPAQAHSDEALAWLKEQIHGRRLKCQLFQRDQYGRIVALPLLPHHRWWWPRRSATRNLPLEMVRAGWGIAYTGTGAQYGGWGQAAFLEAQAEAQAARRGIWHAGTDIETPAEYKKRHRAAQEAAREEEPEAELEALEPGPEPKRKGILDWIIRRGKSGGGNP